jgi:hypothetical protein
MCSWPPDAAGELVLAEDSYRVAGELDEQRELQAAQANPVYAETARCLTLRRRNDPRERQNCLQRRQPTPGLEPGPFITRDTWARNA